MSSIAGGAGAARPRTVVVVVGTRPEAIKLAPVVAALRASDGFRPLLVSTGQHRQMLDQAFEAFGLRPDVDLQIMAPDQTLHEVTARTVTRIQSVLRERPPAWVVVQGDTTTALGAGLAAFYDRIPVAHVEAGLRSGDRHAPFPEEINRRIVDQIAELLLAPTERAAAALRAEGHVDAAVHVTGNTVVDALLAAREVARARRVEVPGLPEAVLKDRRMLLVTAHRRESFGAPFVEMCLALREIARRHPDVAIVYPVHLNPHVDEPVRRLLGGEERVVLLPPVSYLPFVVLLERAHLVLTDSGGVQEEAPTFGKPLLVMRELTERPEGIAAGVARLVGTSARRILAETSALLTDPSRYREMTAAGNPYGDGFAARRIVEILARHGAARPRGLAKGGQPWLLPTREDREGDVGKGERP